MNFPNNDVIEPCLSVVMPVYNEAPTVLQVISSVLAQRPVQELIVVDDCSRDGTWEKLQSVTDPRVRIFKHEVNQGKGAAVRTAFAQVTAPWVVVQDADLEYLPEEYYLLLGPALAGKAAAVFGSRFLGGTSRRVLYFWHMVGNTILTLLSNITTNLNLSDMETCYKLLRSDLLKKFTIEENRFGIEPEITAKISRLGVPVYEVSVSYHGRTYAEGKKINWKDGFSALRCIAKYGLRR